MAATNVPVTLETPIVVKVLFRGQTKKFKLPLKDLGAQVLPDKVRSGHAAMGGYLACLAFTGSAREHRTNDRIAPTSS